MNIIMLLLFFLSLYGVACVYTAALRMSSAQGFLCAVMSVCAAEGLGALLGRWIPHGMGIFTGVILAVGLLGHFLLAKRVLCADGHFRLFPGEKGRQFLLEFYSPALVGAGIVFFAGILLMRGALVYQYDDLKQWGTAAKFMVENERLPKDEEFFGSLHHFLTPTFFNTFFGIGGKWATGKLVEHNLYTGNLLLIAAGWVLPMGEFGWKEKGRAFGLLGLNLLCCGALYYHSFFNLYVDVILAAFCGGMIGYLILHRRKSCGWERRELIFLAVCGCFMVVLKWGYGILCLILAALSLFAVEDSLNPAFAGRVKEKLHDRRFLLIAGGILLLIVGGIAAAAAVFGERLNVVLPGAARFFTAIWEILTGSTEKARLTLSACVSGLFDQKLTRGALGLNTFMAFILLLAAWRFAKRECESAAFGRLMSRLSLGYLIGGICWFFMILITYVSTFAENESVTALSFNRYTGIYLMIGAFALNLLLLLPPSALRSHHEQTARRIPARSIAAAVMTALLVLNCNESLISYSTGLMNENVAGYQTVAQVKEQSEKVKGSEAAEAEILFIAQDSAERALHRARFDVGMNVSRYKPNSYCFTEKDARGSDISISRTPKELPQLILDGGYEYLWIYKTDSLLNEFCSGYFGMELKSASLYRVVKDGGALQLEYVCGLK